MREDERKNRLEQIKVQQEKMKRLSDARNRLNQLKKNVLVKEYLRLSEMLQSEEILTEEEIRKTCMGKEMPSTCEHDIWFYLGGYRTEHDKDSISVFKETMLWKVEYYAYCCLDCRETIKVLPKDNENFLSEHKVIKLSDSHSSYSNYELCRKMYLNLLCSNTTENAYKKLKKSLV